ncbi:hypothetical protein ACROYT_G016744 [Oculina patagonica]
MPKSITTLQNQINGCEQGIQEALALCASEVGDADYKLNFSLAEVIPLDQPTEKNYFPFCGDKGGFICKVKKEKVSFITHSEANVGENSKEDKGEDLMDTDGEEDNIELEMEEDRAFIEDEEIEEDGPSFYRALEGNRAEQSDGNQPSMLAASEPEKIKQTPLIKETEG